MKEIKLIFTSGEQTISTSIVNYAENRKRNMTLGKESKRYFSEFC
jgi:hypothetical protein